jgi:hypothetical protein
MVKTQKLVCVAVLLLFATLFAGTASAALPTVTGILPEDDDVVDPNPLLSAIITSTGNTTVTFYWQNGAAVEFLGNDTTVPTGIGYTADAVQFQTSWDDYDTTYTWYVCCHDTQGWKNATHNLTIRSATVDEVSLPIIVNFGNLLIIAGLAVGIVGAIFKFGRH